MSLLVIGDGGANSIEKRSDFNTIRTNDETNQQTHKLY